MTKLLLTIHVLAAIIAIGPVTVAASMFPAATRRCEAATLHTLHRICRVYAALGVVVPVFGLATATSLGVLGDAWLLTSIALTVIAAAVLGLAVLPGQAAVLANLAVLPDQAAVPANRAAPASTPAPRTAPAPTSASAPALASSAVSVPAPAAASTAAPAAAAAPAPAAAAAPAPAAAAAPAPAAAAAPALAATTAAAVAFADGRRVAARLGMVTGIFNLLWAAVVVLMIVRPGSTTGA